ncbi:hypothetical protein [Vulcanococcus limneticus]|uniref:hypothetical protein n=1 Tax=Vulcanococcus limneticus TaxID=2170428 RepID=UPI0012FF874D|nr:hypothetical protein [Vulcanococcus limneticus]
MSPGSPLVPSALVLLLAGNLPAALAGPPVWVPVETLPPLPPLSIQAKGQSSRQLVWEVVPAAPVLAAPPADAQPVARSSAVPTGQLLWEPVLPGNGIDLEAELAKKPAPSALTILPPAPSGPTFANLRALWRDDDWKPQISNLVPVGFGPQGPMLSLGGRGIDCTTGAGRCRVPESYNAWRDGIERQGDAYLNTAFGFGDSLNLVGIVITNTTQGVSGSGPRGQDPFLGGNMTGFHITRNFGYDTAMRLGVENWIRWDWPQADLQKNAYGVISQRIRLGSTPEGWFQNLYLTAGAGNGAFRPLDKQIGAQIAAQKAAGCYTFNYVPPSRIDCSANTRSRAVRDGGDFGNLNFIGAAAIEVVDGLHLIGEWSGRNLNMGLSIRPFPELGLVITPMFENIIRNSDYGNGIEIPGAPSIAMPDSVLTDRVRFSLQASLEFKF